MKRVVTFSSGAGSWAAARRVADEHGTADMVLLFADVKGDTVGEHTGEDADNYRFLAKAAADIGAPLVRVADGRDVWQVFKDRKFIGNTRVSICSELLKQKPSREWLDANCDPADTIVYVGIDWTESHRLPAIALNHAPFAVAAPLCDPPHTDKEQVLAELRRRKIEPPRLYDLGFAHANCGGFCVRAGQGQFKRLLAVMPDRYAYHEAREQEFRADSGKDVAILRDRTGGETKPLTLRVLRERIEGGGRVDELDLGGCGCYTAEVAP
jgi:hypothetical protein